MSLLSSSDSKDRHSQSLLEKVFLASLLGLFVSLAISIALMEIFTVLAIVSWGVLKFNSRQFPSIPKSIILVTSLFFISSCVSVLYSGYLTISLYGVVKLGRAILIFLMVADAFSRYEKWQPLLLVLFAAFVVIIADSFYQLLFGYDFLRHFSSVDARDYTRLTGSFKTYGLLAAFFLGLLPVVAGAVFFDWVRNRWRAALLAVLFVLGVFILYKTHSRGAWLAAVLAGFLFAFLIRNAKLAMLLLLICLSAPFVIPRSQLIHFDIYMKEQSLRERYHLWLRAAQVVKARPFFGCGLNTYLKNYPKYDHVDSWRVPGYYAHNGYLQLAAETGLVSLLFFIVLIGLIFAQGANALRAPPLKQYRPLIAGVICGVVALLLQSLVDTTLHNLQGATMIWFFFGLLVAIGSLVRNFQEGR